MKAQITKAVGKAVDSLESMLGKELGAETDGFTWQIVPHGFVVTIKLKSLPPRYEVRDDMGDWLVWDNKLGKQISSHGTDFEMAQQECSLLNGE